MHWLYMWRTGLAVEHWTCNHLVVGSILTGASLHNNLAQIVTKQYNLVPVKGWWRYSAGNVTAGQAESYGSLPMGDDLKSHLKLTACTPGSAPGPTLGNEYGRTLRFYWAVLHIFCEFATIFLFSFKLWIIEMMFWVFFCILCRNNQV